MKKYIADANIGMRILLGTVDITLADTPERKAREQQLYDDTRAILAEVAKGKATLYFHDSVVEEMVFVMTSKKLYNLDRATTSRMLLTLLEAEGIESSDTIRNTLKLFGTVNLDFVDIKLSVLSKELGIPVLTWDKGFSKLTCEYYSPRDIIDSEGSEEPDDES